MAAILLDIKDGDEVILPSFTFVSTANAFVLRGAKLVFADSQIENPNIDPAHIESLITPKTKAIVVVHYAGIACDMDKIMGIANRMNIPVIEDAAQAIDSYYKGRPLGSIGKLGAFSFHETKNIISGEGGLLAINDPGLTDRAEVIREKGTNRSSFFRGEVDKYGWIDIGSSFLPSDIIAAYLYAQLENIDPIQNRRKQIWKLYYDTINGCPDIHQHLKLPEIPDYATNNAHMFYMVCDSIQTRSSLIAFLKEKNIHAVFHYLSLHKSEYFIKQADTDKTELKNSDYYADRLIRLPLYFELTDEQVEYISLSVIEFIQSLAH